MVAVRFGDRMRRPRPPPADGAEDRRHAAGLVLAVAVIVHRPLSRVPENTLKFGVGVIISAFGIYWTGEGLGIARPGHDLALALLLAALLGVRLAGLRAQPKGAARCARYGRCWPRSSACSLMTGRSRWRSSPDARRSGS